MIEIPLLGQMEEDDKFDDWLRSDPLHVDVLGGEEFVFTLEGYVEDDKPEEFHQAIANILAAEDSVLKKAETDIYKYYKDINSQSDPGDDWYVEIARPENVWEHIQFKDILMIKRRPYRDELIYIEVECGCDWEKEHGLQIVFKQGLYVNKIGPYNGHLTNSDAYANDELEDVVYYGL